MTLPSQPTQLPSNLSKKVWNIAHRGARSIAPENTLLAARKAYEIGADMWELDVAMTSDGEMVVIHDDNLERTSDAKEVFPGRKPWLIEAFALEELRHLDFGSWYIKDDPFKQIAQGAVSADEQKEFLHLPIPTLREALLFTKNNHWRVNVEIKDLMGKPGDRAIVEKVTAMINELEMCESVIISSFNHSYIKRAKTKEPRISTAALVKLPSLDPVGLLRRFDAQAYNPYIKTLSLGQITPITSAGYKVFVWTVNSEKAMRKLIDNGVSGIITDFPQILKRVLETVGN